MDSGSLACLTTVVLIITSLVVHEATRGIRARQQERLKSFRDELAQDAHEKYEAMLDVLKWVHQVHQAAYFAEISAQRVLPAKPDNSGWEEVANKLEAPGPCPPQSSLLPETLRYLVLSMEPKLADLKSCVARHGQSLAFIPYDKTGMPTFSSTELQAARKALAEEVEVKARSFNLLMETVEKHFDAAFFAPLDVRLHKGRNDSPALSEGSSASGRPDDGER